MSKDFDDLWQHVKTRRDELKVQSHLAKAEIMGELETLDGKWQIVEQQMHNMEREAKEAVGEFKSNSHVVVEEIANAYDRIKARLSDS